MMSKSQFSNQFSTVLIPNSPCRDQVVSTGIGNGTLDLVKKGSSAKAKRSQI